MANYEPDEQDTASLEEEMAAFDAMEEHFGANYDEDYDDD